MALVQRIVDTVLLSPGPGAALRWAKGAPNRIGLYMSPIPAASMIVATTPDVSSGTGWFVAGGSNRQPQFQMRAKDDGELCTGEWWGISSQGVGLPACRVIELYEEDTGARKSVAGVPLTSIMPTGWTDQPRGIIDRVALLRRAIADARLQTDLRNAHPGSHL